MNNTTPRELIAELRAEGKEWREQVGDMPVFDRAADALENALDELDAMHSWGGLMKLLEEHWPADIFGNSDGRDERADPGPRIVSLINALDAAECENELLRAAIRNTIGPDGLIWFLARGDLSKEEAWDACCEIVRNLDEAVRS